MIFIKSLTTFEILRRVRNLAKTDLIASSWLSVRMQQLGFHRTDFHEV